MYIAIIQAVTCEFNLLSCPSLPVYLRIFRYIYFSCRSSLANWYIFLISVVKFVSARSIFWCNVDVEWGWQGSWASNGAMAPSLPANPNFYLLALFCPLFGSLGCEDCWRCIPECQRKEHSNVVMLAYIWEHKMPNWLSITNLCVVQNHKRRGNS